MEEKNNNGVEAQALIYHRDKIRIKDGIFTGMMMQPIRWTLPRLLALIEYAPPGTCRICKGDLLRDPKTKLYVCCPACHGLGSDSA